MLRWLPPALPTANKLSHQRQSPTAYHFGAPLCLILPPRLSVSHAQRDRSSSEGELDKRHLQHCRLFAFLRVARAVRSYAVTQVKMFTGGSLSCHVAGVANGASSPYTEQIAYVGIRRMGIGRSFLWTITAPAGCWTSTTGYLPRSEFSARCCFPLVPISVHVERCLCEDQAEEGAQEKVLFGSLTRALAILVKKNSAPMEAWLQPGTGGRERSRTR